MRTGVPKAFLSYYPALYPQDELQETVSLLNLDGTVRRVIEAGHPPKYERLESRANYDTLEPCSLTSYGPTSPLRLGDVALARSGDKGSNLNCGISIKEPRMWDWFRSFLSHKTMIELIGDEDWDEDFFLERVEFPKIFAVHFVLYGILGRGVSGSSRLDSLGKGFADYIRDKVIEVPQSLVRDVVN